MIGKKQNPESRVGPEFIRVIYDENGNPIAVKPADVSVMDNKQAVGATNGSSPHVIPYPLEQWLTLISKNILSLKANIEQAQIEMRKFSVPDMTQIHEGIDGANHRIDALIQRMEAYNQQTNEQKMMYKLLGDQLNTMNEIISTIAREFAQQKTLSKDFYEVFNDRIRQLNETTADMNGNFSKMKNIETEIDSLRNDSMQRFSFIDDKVTAMHRQLSASSERTEGDLIVLNDVVAVMNERIAELQNLKNEVMEVIEQNRLDKQLMIEEIISRTSRQLKNLVLKKPRVEVKIRVKKRKVGKVRNIRVKRKIKRVRKTRRVRHARKITRAKINKNLIVKKLKKNEIENYGSALVVTERKSQKYGRAVFDVARKMNKNVVMIMQEKMSEDDGFEPITYDAIDNSEAVFIVTNRKMRKNFAVRNAALKRRVFLINKNLKFKEIKY